MNEAVVMFSQAYSDLKGSSIYERLYDMTMAIKCPWVVVRPAFYPSAGNWTLGEKGRSRKSSLANKTHPFEFEMGQFLARKRVAGSRVFLQQALFSH